MKKWWRKPNPQQLPVDSHSRNTWKTRRNYILQFFIVFHILQFADWPCPRCSFGFWYLGPWPRLPNPTQGAVLPRWVEIAFSWFLVLIQLSFVFFINFLILSFMNFSNLVSCWSSLLKVTKILSSLLFESLWSFTFQTRLSTPRYGQIKSEQNSRWLHFITTLESAIRKSRVPITQNGTDGL